MKLLIVGGGPGGYVAAIRAAQLGAEVTLAEPDALGGTCLNRGCIPTKALLHTAECLEQAREAAACGVNAEPTLDFAKAQARKAQVVKQLVGGVTGLMRANKIKVLKGAARFESPDKITVNGELVPFDKVILATGSLPATPPIPGVDSPRCIDSTGALDLTAVPERLAIVGGGVIGVEIATLYAAMGSKVTVIEMLEEILPPMDRELTGIVRAALQKKGVQIHTGAKVLSVEDRGNCAAVQVEGADGPLCVEADYVLVSVGRKPNTEGLNLEAAGVKQERGRIVVDAQQRTNIANVYAIGDCTGGVMLAHVASAQGEVAAEHAMGHDAAYSGATNPSCVYTHPEFAGVGLTEEQAKARGLDYIVGRFPLMANGKSLIMNDSKGMVKILAGKSYGEILGVHMVGPRATDLIAEGALAIGVEATLDEIIATIHAHPTVGEAVREAALAGYGRAIHIPNP